MYVVLLSIQILSVVCLYVVYVYTFVYSVCMYVCMYVVYIHVGIFCFYSLQIYYINRKINCMLRYYRDVLEVLQWAERTKLIDSHQYTTILEEYRRRSEQ